MATQVYFQGGATAVAQVGTFVITSVSGTPSDTVYTITIGGQTVSVPGDTDVDTTALNLQVALAASTHPYFVAVTWTRATDTVTGTATTAGVPFIAVSSDVGGTGVIAAYSATTVSSGPNDLSTVENYDTGALPQANEVLHFKDLAVNVCWGLDALDGTALDGLIVWDTFTGKLGLNWTKFATSADGATEDATAPEYREVYMTVEVTAVDGPIELGKMVGPGLGAGSGRIMINAVDTQADIIVHTTAASSAESGRPAVRLVSNHASTNIFIKSAPGGVGVAAEVPGETCTIGRLSLSGASSRLIVGANAAVTTFEQREGSARMTGLTSASEVLTTCTVAGGTFSTEGLMGITTFNNNGGTVRIEHRARSGNSVGTANLNHGTTITTGTNEARTWTTTNLDPDKATLTYDPADLTLTTTNFAKSGVVEGDL